MTHLEYSGFKLCWNAAEEHSDPAFGCIFIIECKKGKTVTLGVDARRYEFTPDLMVSVTLRNTKIPNPEPWRSYHQIADFGQIARLVSLVV